MTYKFLPSALKEVVSAAKFYRTAEPGLDVEFLSEIRTTIARICHNPSAWHRMGLECRRCRTTRFPYGIIYSVEDEEVIIVSVMHLHRRPDIWKPDLKEKTYTQAAAFFTL